MRCKRTSLIGCRSSQSRQHDTIARRFRADPDERARDLAQRFSPSTGQGRSKSGISLRPSSSATAPKSTRCCPGGAAWLKLWFLSSRWHGCPSGSRRHATIAKRTTIRREARSTLPSRRPNRLLLAAIGSRPAEGGGRSIEQPAGDRRVRATAGGWDQGPCAAIPGLPISQDVAAGVTLWR